MSSLGQPPVAEERDSSRLIIGIAVAVVIGGALAAAFLLQQPPKAAKPVSPYIASLKLSDFKMSAAENFIGHTVSYIDGTITNTGDKTVTHVVVEVVFQDSMGQLAQREELPLQVVRTNGAYLEPVDVSVSPLAPVVIDRMVAAEVMTSPGRIGAKNATSCSPWTRRSRSAPTSGSPTTCTIDCQIGTTPYIGGATMAPGLCSSKKKGLS